MTTIPLIATIPTDPPSTDDPTTFDARADAFLGDFPGFATEINATATAMNTVAGEVAADAAETAGARDDAQAAAAGALAVTDYVASSATSLTVGTGTKNFTLAETGKAFAVGNAVVLRSRADPSVQMEGAVTAFTSGTGVTEVNVTRASGGGGSADDWLVILKALDASAAGRQALWIPRAAITPRATNGAAAGRVELSANKVVQETLDFDPSTPEYGQFYIRMPPSWDRSTVTFAPVWKHGATATNFKVSWGLAAVAVGDNEAADVARGTAQYSNDTGGVTDRVYIGPESAAITIAGSPAAEDLVLFEVVRKADDATNDTLAIDAGLLGITLYIRTTSGSDA